MLQITVGFVQHQGLNKLLLEGQALLLNHNYSLSKMFESGYLKSLFLLYLHPTPFLITKIE